MNDDFAAQLRSIIDFEADFPLSEITTWQTGGPADFLVKPKTTEQIPAIIKLAKKYQMPWLILGKGSNVLFSDQGFKGIVLKLEMNKIELIGDCLKTEAGASFSELGRFSAEQGLRGLEFAATIPGTVGGAIRGNAGAFNGETKDFLESVEILDCQKENPDIRVLKNDECEFNYRDSIFKHSPDYIILSVKFKLPKGSKEAGEEKIRELVKLRQEKQPLGRSAGSVFKNPPGLFAGKLIEDCGLKGRKIGGAVISEKHANFILSESGAKSADIYELIKSIQKEVKNKFNVDLEMEVQLIGFNN